MSVIVNDVTVYLSGFFLGILVWFYIQFAITKWEYIKFASKARGFYLPILPKIGTMYVAMFTGKGLNSFPLMDWLKTKIGFPCSLWVGYDYNYVTDDPKEIDLVLNHSKCYGKAGFYDNFRVFFKNTLLTVPFHQWHPRRKHIVGSFKPNLLRSYFSIFEGQSMEMVEEMRKKPEIENLCEHFCEYTYTNFFYTHAGLDEMLKFEDMKRLGHLLGGIQAKFGRMILDPIMTIRMYFKWFPKGMTVFKDLKEAKTYIIGLIERKRAQAKESCKYEENGKQVCLLDSLLKSKQMFTDEQLYQELGLFQAAATETTGTSLAFCSILLGIHQDIQETLYREVRDVLGGTAVTYNNVNELTFNDEVIMESLRLLPAISLIGRRCEADVDLGGKIIPKGSNILISIFHLHRNPLYWPDPLKFDPTRFLPENAGKIAPGSFIPFSAGPRDCIGKRQALLLMKVTIANLVRNFRITTRHKSILEFELQSCVSVTAVNDLNCQFTPRT